MLQKHVNKVFGFVLFFLSGCITSKQNDASAIADTVTIYRDTYGVPHIYGPTDESVAFGFAWAQCEDNFENLEDNYIRAIGRAAEVHGEEAFLDDRIVHAMEIVKYSKQEYEQSSLCHSSQCEFSPNCFTNRVVFL